MFRVPENVIVSFDKVKENKCKETILFLLPGLEGHCESLKELADKLSANFTVYGLEYTAEVPNLSIEAAARFNLDQIKRKLIELGKKCCFLAGYSFGGLIAIEMCNLFERSRKEFDFNITSLVLFESSHKFFRVGVHVS